MGRITIRDGKRWLDWDPSESGFGKNPAGIPAGPIPDIDKDPGFLQKCIAETLDFMQREQEQQNIEEKRIRELRAKLDADLKDAAAFTELARSMRDTGARNADKQVLVGLAESRGYTLDKKTLSFSDPKATEKAAEEEPAKEAEGAESPAAEGEEKAAEAGAEEGAGARRHLLIEGARAVASRAARGDALGAGLDPGGRRHPHEEPR